MILIGRKTFALLCFSVLSLVATRADAPLSCFHMYSCSGDPIAGSPANGYEHIRRETCSNSITDCRTDCEASCSEITWCGYGEFRGVISYFRQCVDTYVIQTYECNHSNRECPTPTPTPTPPPPPPGCGQV